MLWVPVTLVAAALQTARNATQSGLVTSLGTLGATQVRFIFGLPFALLFLALANLIEGPLPGLTLESLRWALMGAVAQIAATALMLLAMQSRGFAAATALVKTEPILIALAGWALLGDHLTMATAAAIGMATFGVVLLYWQPGSAPQMRATMIALAAAGLFGLSAIGFRGAITALPDGGFVIRASLILALSLAMQAGLLAVWLGLFNRPALMGSFGQWRASLGAGFLGAAASQCWFLGFALTSAANVRTLALVEVLIARIVGGKVFGEGVTPRETIGMILLVAGVGALLLAA